VTGFWKAEVTFCRRIASRVPIRVPRVCTSLERGARFVLLLEIRRDGELVLPGFDGALMDRANLRSCLIHFNRIV
jgi:hypothetical protein